MGSRWLVVALGVGLASLGCKQEARERDPLIDFPATPATGGTAAGMGGMAGVGASYGGCATDGLVAPEPSALADDDLTAVAPSDGCGKAYACEDTLRSLHTEGVKDHDCADELDGKPRCDAWKAERQFVVRLPPQYDPQKPYGLVLEATGCNASAGSVLPLNDDSIIRVGLAPPPHSIGYPLTVDEAVNCFDDREGDDSIEWEFYERLYDKLNTELCIDRRRVFVSANESGGLLADQLLCKYSADAVRPLRGMLANSASMDAEPQYRATCSQAPAAAMWLGKSGFGSETFDEGKSSIARLMSAAHCPGGDYDHAALEDFPLGSGQPHDACQRIVGCDPLYPLVTCVAPRGAQTPLNDYAAAGFGAFTKLFDQAPLAPTR